MTYREIRKMIFNHKFSIAFIALICGLIGFFIGSQNSAVNKFSNSLFIDFSVQDKYQKSSSLENLEASDQLAESIQGWVKDISFQNQIKETTQLGFEIQAKKQEKNNLIISFKTTTADQAQVIASAVNQELQTRISKYNNHADLTLFANTQPLQVNKKSSTTLIYTVLSTLMGLVLGLLFAGFAEILFPKKRPTHTS